MTPSNTGRQFLFMGNLPPDARRTLEKKSGAKPQPTSNSHPLDPKDPKFHLPTHYLPPFHLHRSPEHLDCQKSADYVAKYYPQLHYGYTQREFEQYYGDFPNPLAFIQSYYSQCLEYQSSLKKQLATDQQSSQQELSQDPNEDKKGASEPTVLSKPVHFLSPYYIPGSARTAAPPLKSNIDIEDPSLLHFRRYDPSASSTIASGIFKERPTPITVIPYSQAQDNEKALRKMKFDFSPTVASPTQLNVPGK